MNPYYLIDDPESEYHGQIATLIVRETVGTGLAMYRCKMDNGDVLSFLAHQIDRSFFLRSEADKYIKELQNGKNI